ncbi:MAG: insulinase family protein [Prevotella sp.]|nr:insulinase family protein [Prevotella sp.]
MNYNTCKLDSGLRVIHLPSASDVIICGIAVKAGTRNEQRGQEGLAHFCEHLAFKGTRRRRAVQIINAIEGVGGELNAFTNKEDTVYYCAIQRRHFTRAVDVLCDIVFFSQHPQMEVEKECEVVCDEIESYEDTPAELIYDEIEDILFQGHPLGHHILGTSEQVRSYTSADADAFTQRWYRPENCIFFASGNVDFGQLKRLLARQPSVDGTGEQEQTNTLTVEKQTSTPEVPAVITRQRGTHQAHVMLGTTAYAATDPRRWALYLLNNIVGGPGLNSRLNLALRERRGLVYAVESSMVAYSDTGAWTIYFGCDPADVDRCRRIVRRELDRLMAAPLSATQLRRAKQQLQGQLAIACDSREQFALDFAKNFLHTGKLRDLTDIMRHIDGLTAADLQQTAQELFAPERLVTLVYT